jgi:cytolysin-activating lysine-acyltransferase
METVATDEGLAKFEGAKKELAKLPLLGPAMWLFSRDQHLRFTFFADIDWRLLPPLVLDQCRQYSKADFPWAFVTWAFVSEAVDQRLRSASPLIAPHEWKSGDIPWLIDVVSPFEKTEVIAAEVASQVAQGKTVRAWLMNAQGERKLHEIAPRG